MGRGIGPDLLNGPSDHVRRLGIELWIGCHVFDEARGRTWSTTPPAIHARQGCLASLPNEEYNEGDDGEDDA